MSEVLRATISTIAESLGITSHIKESVYANLAMRGQAEVLEIIGDALQLMAVTKRATLSVLDVNTAIERKWRQPLLGFSSFAPKVLKAGTVNAQDLLFYEDKQIPADAFARAEMKPLPIETDFEVEWLAVAGTPLYQPEEDRNENEAMEQTVVSQVMATKQKFQSELEIASSKHVCSHELAVFYQNVKKDLEGDDRRMREVMLDLLRRSDAIQTIVPYFVTNSLKMLKDTRVCKKLVAVRAVKALCSNANIKFLDVYMAEMLTVGLTVLLNPGLLPMNLGEQLILQNAAADLVAELMDRSFRRSYAMVQPRITSELTSVLLYNDRKEKGGGLGIVEKRGALIGLIRLGLPTVASSVIPHLDTLLKETEQVVAEEDLEKYTVGTSLYYQELKAAGLCVHLDTYKMSASGSFPISIASSRYSKMREQFGADLLPYVVDESSLMYF